MLVRLHSVQAHLTDMKRYQVGDRTVGAIEKGVMVLVDIEARDTIEDCQWAAKKLTKLRLWPDDKGIFRFNYCPFHCPGHHCRIDHPLQANPGLNL